MTPSDLKYALLATDPGNHFFDRKTMSFFGDTIKNFGVRRATITSATNSDGETKHETFNKIVVWELYRKRPVKHGLNSSSYWHPKTFKQVYDQFKM